MIQNIYFSIPPNQLWKIIQLCVFILATINSILLRLEKKKLPQECGVQNQQPADSPFGCTGERGVRSYLCLSNWVTQQYK